MRGLYLGLDNTQPNLARVVCVTTTVGWACPPHVYARAQSRGLPEFQSFWAQEGFRPDGLAATTVRHDPFGIMAWLESQGMSFTRYNKDELYHGFDEAGDPDDLPPCYRRAYSLALRAAFRLEAPTVAIELGDRLHILEHQLLDIRCILGRLLHEVPF